MSINLNKNGQPQRRKFRISGTAVLVISLIASLSVVFTGAYFDLFHISGDAREVVRNIEEKPEQWSLETPDTNSIFSTLTFRNDVVGIVVSDDPDADGSDASVMFVSGGTTTEPFDQSQDRAFIWKALKRVVEKTEAPVDVKKQVMEKLRAE